MKSLKIVTLSALSALSIAPVLLSAQSASALPTGMTGNYIGGGLSAGVTSGDHTDATFGGNVQGRLAIPRTPVSLRGAALIGGDSTALMPMLTVDLPVSRNANLYAGAGYSFVTNSGAASPLGTQDSVVLTAGAEAAVTRNVVVYGDTKVGLDAYDNSNPAVSIQLGAGYRF